MERLSWAKKAVLMVGIGMLSAFSVPAGSLAGVSFAPEKKEAPDADSYPESRFGAPPQKREPGMGRHYAATQVEDMEAPDSENGPSPSHDVTGYSGARAPASVDPKADASAKAKRDPLAPRTAESFNNPEPASVAARKGVQEVSIIAGDLGYFPKTVFVSRDIPVRMYVTGASKNTLCIMMDTFQVRKQVRSQKIEEITFTPSLPGKYRFYCPVNGMEGTVVVKDLASNEAENSTQ